VEYFGIFLILVAAALNLVAPLFGKNAFRTRTRAAVRAVPEISPGVAAALIAVSGVFIFVTSISSR
jgi:hypothetical protein